MKTKQFTPIQVGKIDEIKQSSITKFYKDLCVVLTVLEVDVEAALTPNGVLPTNLFWEFLRSSNKIDFLKRKYVEMNNVDIPGISTEKLIEQNMLDIDWLESETIADIADYNGLAERFNVDNVGFEYNLELLHDENGGFGLNEDFQVAVRTYCSFQTETPEQNEVFEIFQSIADAYNRLFELGIARPSTLQSVLDLSFDNKMNNAKTFSLSPLLFKRRFLRKFNPFRNGRQSYFENLLPEPSGQPEKNKSETYTDDFNSY